ncbi:unnamed protein product [Caenorhabditis auriculariae]|uniref:G-protein coupled receptors family 1 profile domain-containing protein n=1 Tax=Caenorhabditis auriculariae TaxID=2777116 RepID=A0A8S1HIG7_9PELO|nr:unnamed protein product [Caenorhabditis auriculariae]
MEAPRARPGRLAQRHLLTFGVYSLLLSFCYRYYVITRQPPERRTILTILALVYIPSFIQLILSLIMVSPEEEMRRIFEEAYPQYKSENVMISGVADIRDIWPAVAISHAIFSIIPIYAAIFVLRQKISNQLNIPLRISSETKSMQKQFLKALTIQTCIPMFSIIAISTFAIGHLKIFNHPALEYSTPFSLLLTPVLPGKKMEAIRMLFSTAHVFIALLGCTFNSILIYIALFHSPMKIRSYATLIVNFAFTDLLTCVADLFVQQRLIPVGDSLVYVSNGFCQFFGHSACFIGYNFMLHLLTHGLYLGTAKPRPFSR